MGSSSITTVSVGDVRSTHPGRNNKMTASSRKGEGRGKAIPVDIVPETYEMLKEKAGDNETSIRQYTNDLLFMIMRKMEFIKKYVPDLKLDGIGHESIYIKDYRHDKDNPCTAELRLKDNQVFCVFDNSHDCIHIHFGLCLPEISVLMPEENNEQQEEEYPSSSSS